MMSSGVENEGSVFVIELQGVFYPPPPFQPVGDSAEVNVISVDEVDLSARSGPTPDNHSSETALSSYAVDVKSSDIESPPLRLKEDQIMHLKSTFRRALVVDDSKMNRKMMIRTVKLFIADIEEAEDGEQCVECVKKAIDKNESYDVIFLDSIMPVMCGTEACATVRMLGYKGLIIGVTGNVLPEDVTSFLSVGANAVLGKPVKISDLQNMLAH